MFLICGPPLPILFFFEFRSLLSFKLRICYFCMYLLFFFSYHSFLYLLFYIFAF